MTDVPNSQAARPPGRCAASGRAGGGQIGLRGVPGSALVLVALLIGCGARASADGSGEDGEEFGTPGAGEPGGSGGRGGRSGGSGAGMIDPTAPIDLEGIMLPECEPGFSMSAAGSRECTYLFRGDCHEDPLMACSCACRGFADSRCIIGGFLNPDEPQTVSCVQR
jgi:hypothetical protein